MKKRMIIVISLVVLIIIYSVWRWYDIQKSSDIVILSGFIEGTEVIVKSQVASQVKDIAVKEGQPVKEGDLIASIDYEKTEFELNSAKSELSALDLEITKAEGALVLFEEKVERGIQKAQAGFEIAEQQLNDLLNGYPVEDVESARIAMELAGENLKFAQDDYDRFNRLLDQGVVSEKEQEKVEQLYNAAKREFEIRKETYNKLNRGFDIEKVEQSKKNLEITQVTLQDAVASRDEVKLKNDEIESLKKRRDALQSSINLIQSRLGDFTIYSPVDGVITQKHIEIGELAAPGSPVVTIVKPVEKWIRVYVPATQLGAIKLGDELPIVLDAFEDKQFTGCVSFIAEDAEFTPKNVQIKEERVKQVYEVRLDITENAEMVKTGMEGDVILDLTKKW